jgi:hypothetical protein
MLHFTPLDTDRDQRDGGREKRGETLKEKGDEKNIGDEYDDLLIGIEKKGEENKE